MLCCECAAGGDGMIQKEMGSKFGSVIIDDVWQCQAATDGFPPGCLCTNFPYFHYEKAEVTFLLNQPYLVVRNNVSHDCTLTKRKACSSIKSLLFSV